MTTLLTTAQVAAQHGVTPRRILAIAAARGVAPKVDQPTIKMWTPAQAKALTPGPRGRPRGKA